MAQKHNGILTAVFVMINRRVAVELKVDIKCGFWHKMLFMLSSRVLSPILPSKCYRIRGISPVFDP